MVLGNQAITFFKDSLDKFQNNNEVAHINGWVHPVQISSGREQLHYSKIMHCWGWATWKDRWEDFIKFLKTESIIISKEQSLEINFNGNLNNLEQMIKNEVGLVKTWAVYWQVYIFLNNLMCLSPYKSLTLNTGLERDSSSDFILKITQNLEIDQFIDINQLSDNKDLFDNALNIYLNELEKKINFKKITIRKFKDFLKINLFRISNEGYKFTLPKI